MKPDLVKTTVDVPRGLDIMVAWYANISLMWFYTTKMNKSHISVPTVIFYSLPTVK
jgi:hypothetical protein